MKLGQALLVGWRFLGHLRDLLGSSLLGKRVLERAPLRSGIVSRTPDVGCERHEPRAMAE
jgi:hypothetical protein